MPTVFTAAQMDAANFPLGDVFPKLDEARAKSEELKAARAERDTIAAQLSAANDKVAALEASAYEAAAELMTFAAGRLGV